MLMSEQDDIII